MSFKTISGFFVAVAAMLLISSCSKKTNTQGRYIPANAAVVVHVNSEAISAKLPWDEVKQNELFKSLYADSSITSLVKAALDNPENTGIDINNDFVWHSISASALKIKFRIEVGIHHIQVFRKIRTRGITSA